MLLDSRDGVRAFYSLTGFRARRVLAHDLTIMLGPAEPFRQLAGSAENDSSPDKTLSTIKPLASRDLYLHILYWRCDENREVSVSYPIDAPEASELFTWMMQRVDLGKNWTEAHPEAPQFLHQLLVESNKRPASIYCSQER